MGGYSGLKKQPFSGYLGTSSFGCFSMYAFFLARVFVDIALPGNVDECLRTITIKLHNLLRVSTSSSVVFLLIDASNGPTEPI